MRIRMLTTIAGPLGTWYRDQEADVPEDFARELIRVSAAVALDPIPILLDEVHSSPEAAVLPPPEETEVLPKASRRIHEAPPHRRKTP